MMDPRDLVLAKIMDHAPLGLTRAERLLLVAIAVRARQPNWECELPRGDVMNDMGLSAAGVQAALRRLAAHGLDVRVPIGTGKDGRPFYTVPGRVMQYRLPDTLR